MSTSANTTNSVGDYWNNNVVWSNNINTGLAYSGLGQSFVWNNTQQWPIGVGADSNIYVDIGVGEWITKEDAARLVALGRIFENEEQLRNEFPALQSVWEEYQTMLALVKENLDNEV